MVYVGWGRFILEGRVHLGWEGGGGGCKRESLDFGSSGWHL